MNGGGRAATPIHRLEILHDYTRLVIIVDINTSRPDIENERDHSHLHLTEIATGKIVVTGTTFSRVSYDIPGSSSGSRACADCATRKPRAAKVIAANIR